MKLKLKPIHIMLLILFLVVVSLRIYTSLNMQNFSSGEAYYNERIVNHLIHEKSFLDYDPLSYGGKELLKPQLFHLILALFTLGDKTLLKIIPEIFMGLIVFVVYFIGKEITQNEKASLIAALFSSFVPILFVDTLNVISEYTLAIPLLLFMLYCLLKLDNRKYLYSFIVSAVLLPLIHPIAIIFILVCIVYFFLLSGGSLHATKLKKEAVLAASLIIILIQFIQYKKAFLLYSAGIIWQNAPANIIADSFRGFTVADLLLGIGLIPLIIGAIGLYIGITQERKKSVYLFSSLIFSTLLIIALRLITISLGIILLGIIFGILSSVAIDKLLNYTNKIKFSLISKSLLPIILILFLFTSFFPIYSSIKQLNDINNEKINDLLALKEKFPEDVVVLTNLQEGNLITGISARKNVIDTNFLMAPNSVERIKDTKIIYQTFTQSVAMELIKKYKINIIYLSPDTKMIYNVDELVYTGNLDCFQIFREDFYVIKC